MQGKLNLLVCVAVALLASCRAKPPANVFVDPALALLLPPETTSLAGVRMEKLKATPAYRKYFANRKWTAIDRFQRETGIDPRKDMWEFVIAGTPSGGLVTCRGKFAEFGMEPKSPYPGAQRTSYRGYTLVGNDEYAVTFLNATTGMAGPVAVLKRVLDSRDKGTLGVPKALEPLVRAVPPESQIWIAGNVAAQLGGLTLDRHGPASNFSQFAGSITDAWAGLDMRSGLKVTALARCRTPEDAGRLNSTVRAAVGLGRLNTPPERTDLLRVWDAFRSDIREGSSVVVDANVSEQDFESWLDMFVSRLGA